MTKKLPSTAPAFKASIEQRLKARAAGQNMNRLRILWLMERWLARLVATSPSLFMLKGGLALELRLERARTTKDIDLWMKGTAREMGAALEAARAHRPEPEDFLEFTWAPDPDSPTVTEAVYEGHRFRVQATLAGKRYGEPFGLDIAVADPTTGAVEELTFEPFLEEVGIVPVRVRVYPVATHIAEKLHAYTLPRPQDRPNSRVKDLVDLALIADAAGSAVTSPEEIAEACRTTFGKRGTHPVPEALPPFPSEWRARYPKMKVDDDLPWADMDKVWAVVVEWVDPILALVAGRA